MGFKQNVVTLNLNTYGDMPRFMSGVIRQDECQISPESSPRVSLLFLLLSCNGSTAMELFNCYAWCSL